ncbi:MAG: glycosyltransferase family 4 protein [Cyanobacteria bacterium J06648_11]
MSVVPRILLISSNSSARGGGERYLIYLTQGLRQLGAHVSALLSDVDYMDGWAEGLAEAGADVWRRPLLGLRSRPLRFVQAIGDRKQQQAIAAACRDISPDGVLVNQQYDEDGLDFVAGALAADVCPVMGLMHMPMTATKNQRPLGRWRGMLLDRWFERHPYRLALVSEGCRREFEQYYRHPRPTHLVYYGCPFLETTNPETANSPETAAPALPLHWRHDVPTVAFSGQLVPQKNMMLMVNAWLWLRQQGVPAQLLLVGDGPDRAAIEQRLQSSTVSSQDWHITGWQTHPEAFYPAMDLYATTSHFEGLPLSLLEVVGRGIPAVATDFNGASDVAERAAWVKVAPERTAAGVGGAMQEAIAQLDERKRLAREGCSGFREYFSLARMAKDTLAVMGLTAG